MGNIIFRGPFEYKKIDGVSEKISNYINKYLELYGEDTGLSNNILWNTIYPTTNFDSKTFKKIKQMTPELQNILDLSFSDKQFSLGQPTGAISRSIESIKLLEYWDINGVLDKLCEINEKYQDLDFSSMSRVDNATNIVVIGYHSNISHKTIELKIPFKSDNKLSIHITP